MSSSFLKVRLDEDLKKEAGDLSKSMGLTISEAVRMFLVTFVKEQKIPFDIEKPNKETIKALKDAEEGKTTRYASFADLVKEVENEKG
ncbi:MAG: type II toxin-antitoxin system RelB/DinJ family antitoxin [Burkholderiales bacterium]|nr:type II toxin-antitoxin system RelB/DinJ family antitoxin [Burkholderiales bacterium]